MRVLHILAVLSMLLFGLTALDAYGARHATAWGVIFGILGGALMPYGIALTWAFLVVGPSYSGASLRKLARRADGLSSRHDAMGANEERVRLQAFRETCAIRYHSASRRWILEESDLDDERSASAGWGDLRYTGLASRRICFVAFFVEEGSVWLHVDGQAFNLSDGSTVLTRRTLFPFVKRFEAWQRGQMVFRCTYLWADVHDWPDDEDLDIFLFAAVSVRGASRLERFAWFWTQRCHGVPVRNVIPFEQRPQ